MTLTQPTKLALTLGLAALLGVGALAGCAKKGGGAAAGPTIKVGVYGSLTGSDATFGQSTKKGIELAVKEINAAGGVGGAKLVLTVEDDQGRPEEAATVVDKLISQDNVISVIGEVASSRSIAAAPKCQNRPAGPESSGGASRVRRRLTAHATPSPLPKP